MPLFGVHIRRETGESANRVRRSYDTYWGKADPALDGWHLAALHMLDVAAVATRMLERSPVLRRRLAALVGLPEAQLTPFIAALVAVHDLGKLDVRFQLKAPQAAIALDSRREGVSGAGSYDHGSWGYVHARSECHLVDALGAPDLIEPLLQAVTGHHGALPSSRPHITGSAGIDTARRFRTQDSDAREAFVEDVVALFARRGAPLPFASPSEPTSALVILVAGLCSVADWIGSQVEHFPYVGAPVAFDAYFVEHALPRADAALQEIGLSGARPSGRAFAELFPGREPRDVQRITEGLALPEGPALVILEAQMGSGKTEAALSLAERFLARGDATRLYVGLPTQATANGMLERVEQAAALLFDGPVQLRLAHGQSRRHPAFQRLVQRSLSGGYGAGAGDDEAQVVCARWFLSRKRALLADVGVGTVDQAMQAAIRVSHHFVRTFALASSVVVIDEVHAYDAYMEVILERLVEWLGALGAPVLLLSATLPAERRHLLSAAYAGGAGWSPPQPAEGSSAPYPLVTVVSSSGVSTHSLDTAIADREIVLERIVTDAPSAHVLARLGCAVAQRAMVGWIRNTVADAQAAYDDARSLGLRPLLFHARLRPKDRAAIEARVLSLFGPKGRREGTLLIATQVVEQSLDLDFDLLATDLAPIDLVLQRAGRLWRHERARPEGLDRRLLVVEPEPEATAALRFGGSGRVYDEVTLWLAHNSLAERQTLALPSVIRPIVEASYDPETRAARIAAAPNREALERCESKRARALAAGIPAPRARQAPDVVPARAGMNRTGSTRTCRDPRGPRTRGDEPILAITSPPRSPWSPHARG